MKACWKWSKNKLKYFPLPSWNISPDTFDPAVKKLVYLWQWLYQARPQLRTALNKSYCLYKSLSANLSNGITAQRTELRVFQEPGPNKTWMETAPGLFIAFEGPAQLSPCNLNLSLRATLDSIYSTPLRQTDQTNTFWAVNLTNRLLNSAELL